MNKRHTERKLVKLPVKIHALGEGVGIREAEDISRGGFFVRTNAVRVLELGEVTAVSINLSDHCLANCHAEVVRVDTRGVAFHIIDSSALSVIC